MTHERDPLDSEQELAKTQMPGHPLRMPDPHGGSPARPAPCCWPPAGR
jgi:hypothetical protein